MGQIPRSIERISSSLRVCYSQVLCGTLPQLSFFCNLQTDNWEFIAELQHNSQSL